MKSTFVNPIYVLLAFCFSWAGFAANIEVVRLGEEKLGTSARSVEQVLDDGGIAVIFSPADKADEAYRGAYLVHDDSVVLISAYENIPNLFGWPWAAQNLVGPSDGSQFWCVSKDKTGANVVKSCVHYYGPEGLKFAPSIGTQRIYLSEAGKAMLYCGTGESNLGSFNQSVFTPEGEKFSLEKNTGLDPAVTSDFQSLFYLAVQEDDNTRLLLRKYDLETGESEDLEEVGDREVLGLFNGGFLKDQHAVCASADGGVVVYRFAEANVPKLRVALRDSAGMYSFKTLVGTEGATAPAISANGQFVAYRQNGCIYRYDLSQGVAEVVSQGTQGTQGNQNISSSQPAISPNGRYVAYVDDAGALWRADCGAAIFMEEDRQYFLTDSAEKLGFVVNGASEDTTIRWEFVDDEIAGLPGTIVTNDGEEVQCGEAYSVSSLPWSFKSQSTSGASCQIRLTLNSGYSSVLTLVVSDFVNLTAAVDKGYACRYTDLHFPNSESIGVVTNAMGDKQDDMEFWNYGVSSKIWQKLLDGKMTKLAVASQDGTVVYWADAQGAFYRNDVLLLGGGVSEVVISQDGHVAVIQDGALKFSSDHGTTFTKIADTCQDVRISADGATMAWIEGTTLKVSYRFGEESLDYAKNVSRLFGMTQDGLQLLYQDTAGCFHGAKSTSTSVQFTLSTIPSNAQNVVFSSNGRRVMWTAVPEEAGAKASLYSLDVDILKKSAPVVATCLTPGVVRDVLKSAVSPSAQYAVLSTAADMEKGGTTTAENQSVNLFQWTDSQWSNQAPYFGVTSLGETLEDTEKEFSLYMKDADDNALVARIFVQPGHGTAKMVTPAKGSPFYKLFYTPEQDFSGEDQVTLTLSDGSVTITRTLGVTVKPVNDPPVWDDEQTPSEVSVNALEAASITLVATDVDNMVEQLVYSLQEGAPSWASVEGNQLMLTPGLRDAGQVVLTAQVSDGEYTVPKEITVTVCAGEAEMPVEVLLNASTAPSQPKEYAEYLQVTVAGCWQDLTPGQWHALSLPGTADVEQLCTALGCTEIYIYQGCTDGVPAVAETGSYQAVSTGTLPAGTGFWAKPVWDAAAVITLTPAEPSAETQRFIGPTWLDEEREEDAGELFEVQNGVFQKTTDWEIGRGYFR